MHESDLEEVRRVWETLAREDPLWAILSEPSKRGGKWTVEEFFREGQVEVAQLMSIIESFNYPVSRGLVLDFGCGVGRLSQALAEHFQQVVGIDISERMLELARDFNRFGSRVEYIHNTVDDLPILEDQTFDFVYSNIVLQHMHPKFAVGYIKEFLRITKPGGYVVFQVPSHLTEEYLPHDSTETPMGLSSCRAKLRIISCPETLQAGQSATLQVEVTNDSSEDWVQRRVLMLNLGSQWVKAEPGALARPDQGRSRLPGRVPAGSKTTMPLEIKAPDEAGKYRLEIDLVQEGVRWFRDVGSPILTLALQITPKPARSSGDLPSSEVKTSVAFTMEGVRREIIEQLISEAGAQLLLAQEHVTEWYSYKYFVRR